MYMSVLLTLLSHSPVAYRQHFSLNFFSISPQVEVQSLLAAEVMGGAKNTAQKSSLKSLSHLWEQVSRACRTETCRQ